MQDIDFDEIDRAVNSVTRGRTDDRTSNPIAESTPSVPVPSPVVSPAARRSTGRFMDVVHPSSDMRPSSVNSIRSDTPKPTPTIGIVPRESIATEPVFERPAPPIARPEPATISSSAFHWPDPIDVAAPATLAATEPLMPVLETVTAVAEPTPVQTPEPVTIPEPIAPEEVAPLESPFLVDAKVEKRPLGAFSTNDADPDLLVLEDFPVETLAEVAETAEEEKEDILLLDTHSVDEDVPELIPARTEALKPIEVSPLEAIPVGPTSINQQYTEQPRSTEQTSGAIFDTEAYHQPLVHPVKKRSGVLIAVWIVALILVGGAIGAGIYFVVLPLLG